MKIIRSILACAMLLTVFSSFGCDVGGGNETPGETTAVKIESSAEKETADRGEATDGRDETEDGIVSEYDTLIPTTPDDTAELIPPAGEVTEESPSVGESEEAISEAEKSETEESVCRHANVDSTPAVSPTCLKAV